MNAEWKWLRFEWQARGSIHAHGCAKLSNDPGLCSLVKTEDSCPGMEARANFTSARATTNVSPDG